MGKETKKTDAKNVSMQAVDKSGPAGFVLFVAWFGALAYFIGQVDGFWNIILAFFKACVWPAYLIYYLLQSLSV